MGKEYQENASVEAHKLYRIITNSEIWACQEAALCAVLYAKKVLGKIKEFGNTKLSTTLKITMQNCKIAESDKIADEI